MQRKVLKFRKKEVNIKKIPENLSSAHSTQHTLTLITAISNFIPIEKIRCLLVLVLQLFSINKIIFYEKLRCENTCVYFIIHTKSYLLPLRH